MRLSKRLHFSKFSKIAVLGSLLVICFLLSFYFHFIMRTEVVFTHFFYLPIILAGLWWPERGIGIPIFLALWLLVSHSLSSLETPLFADIARSASFILVGVAVIILNRRRLILSDKLRSALRREKELADRVARENKEKYRTLVESAMLGITVFQDGRIVYANRAAADLAGCAVEDLLSLSFKKIIGFMHPDDCRPVIENGRKALTGQMMPEKIKMRFFRNDGTMRWLEISQNFIKHSGRSAIQTISMDITERLGIENQLKDAHQYARGLIESSLDALVTFNINGIITDVNGETCRLTGRSREELIGKPFRDNFTDPDKAGKGAARSFKEGKVTGYRLVLRSKDGTETPVSYNASTYKDAKGRVKGIFAAARDITEFVHWEESRKITEKKLKNVHAHLRSVREEESKRIAREIHDELEQSLTALKINVFRLKNCCGGVDDAGRIEKILKIIDQLIIAFRRISTELRPAILDDLGLMAAVEWQVGEFRKKTGIRAEASIGLDADKEKNVLDPTRSITVFRVLQEALSNAARHAGATEVLVNFRQQGDFLMLEVRDNGSGITEKQISDPKSFGIIGMQERAESCGGRIDIRRVPVQGTVVTLLFPVERRRMKR